MRGDVALTARIGVRLPRAADVVGALDEHEVVDPLLLEADREAQAGEAGADDRDAHVRDGAARALGRGRAARQLDDAHREDLPSGSTIAIVEQ